MNGAGNAILHLGVQLREDIPVVYTGLLHITNSSLLDNVANQKPLHCLVLGHTAPAVGAPNRVHMATTMLVSTTTTPFDSHVEMLQGRPQQTNERDARRVAGGRGRSRKGSVAKALEIVDDLLALRPDHAPWQLVRAQALEFLGDLKAARHAFEKVLEKDPLSARALQGLATVMSKAGEGEEMLEMLRRAVQTATQTGKTRECKNLRMVLGQMYTVQGNFQEALELYKELEKEDPKDFRPYLCQGVIYSLLEDKVKADTAFLKYRRRCPKTFPERGYLDDLMIGAKTEARKALIVEKLKPPKGKKQPKPLRQPIIETGVTQNPMSEELELDQD